MPYIYDSEGLVRNLLPPAVKSGPPGGVLEGVENGGTKCISLQFSIFPEYRKSGKRGPKVFPLVAALKVHL